MSKSSHHNTRGDCVTMAWYKTIALPPDHDMCVWHSPAWSLPTESVAEKIIHVLRFAIVGSVVVFVHTDIDPFSLTVRLKTNDKGLLRLGPLHNGVKRAGGRTWHTSKNKEVTHGRLLNVVQLISQTQAVHAFPLFYFTQVKLTPVNVSNILRNSGNPPLRRTFLTNWKPERVRARSPVRNFYPSFFCFWFTHSKFWPAASMFALSKLRCKLKALWPSM